MTRAKDMPETLGQTNKQHTACDGIKTTLNLAVFFSSDHSKQIVDIGLKTDVLSVRRYTDDRKGQYNSDYKLLWALFLKVPFILEEVSKSN